jgi:hypothetical protein
VQTLKIGQRNKNKKTHLCGVPICGEKINAILGLSPAKRIPQNAETNTSSRRTTFDTFTAPRPHHSDPGANGVPLAGIGAPAPTPFPARLIGRGVNVVTQTGEPQAEG